MRTLTIIGIVVLLLICVCGLVFSYDIDRHPDTGREVMQVKFDSTADAIMVIGTIAAVVQEVIDEAQVLGIPAHQYEQEFDSANGADQYRVSLSNEIIAHAGAFAIGKEFLEKTGLDFFWYLLLPGDVNKDGIVDLTDQALLGQAYGSQIGDAKYNWDADFNKNFKVDLVDLGLMGQNWGRTLHSCNPADCNMRPDRGWLFD